MMITAYIGLGSNLDGPKIQLKKAVDEIEHIPDTQLCKISSFYRTTPVGPQDQPDYINAVVQIKTGLKSDDLLIALLDIEKKLGRKRGKRWGARIIDLDLLLYGQEEKKGKNLVVPHPELKNRAFVLYPLYEIAPELEIPGLGNVEKLLHNVNPGDVCKL